MFGKSVPPAFRTATPFGAPEPFFATIEWNNTGNTFSTGTNWVGNTAPANSTGTDIGSFGSTGASAVNPSLTANRSINGISFLSGAFAYTFGSSPSSTLTIGTGGISDSATNTETLGSTFIAAISASETWTSNAGATLDVEGTVDLNNTNTTARTLTNTGAGNFIYNGTVQNSFAGNNSILAFNTTFSGTATLSGANTHSGGTTLSASSGSFVLGNKAAFGTGTAAINGVSISANTNLSGANALANAVTFGGNNTFTGSNNIEFSGPITDTSSRTVTNNISTNTLKFSNTFGLSSNAVTNTLTVSGTGNTTISGVIANNGTGGSATSGNLIKSGAGTLALSNANTYAGTTTISAGALALTGTGSLASTKVSTAGGATFDVSGLTTPPLTLTNAQTLDGTNTGATAGTINGSLTMGSTSPLTLSYASGNPTLKVTNGTLTLASGNPVTVTTTSALPAADYTLISANGTTGFVTGTAPTSLTVNGSGLAAGTTAVLQITGSQLILHVTTAPLFYRSVASGNWNATATWESSTDNSTWVAATATPTSADQTITVRSPHTVTVTASVDADQLTVDSGGTLTINGGVTFTVADGTGTDATINGSLTTSNGVTNNGQVAVNGTLTLTAGTFTNAANLTFGSGANISRSGGSLSGTPTFSGTVNVTYTGSSGIATGSELPTSTTALNNLTVNMSSGAIVSCGSAITVNGTFTLNSGTTNGAEFDANGAVTFKGDFSNTNGVYSGGTTSFSGTTSLTANTANNAFGAVTITSGASLNSNATIRVNGNWNDNATSGGASGNSGGTVQFTGTATIGGTVTTPNFLGLQIAANAGTVTALKGLAIQNFQLSSGTFDDGGFNHTVSSQWTKSSGTFTATGTITFNGSFGSTTSASNFNNLTINKSNPAMSLQLQGDVTIAGNWTQTAGSLDAQNRTVTFNGNGNTQTISGTNSFFNLTVNHTNAGVVTAAGSTLAVTGLFHLVSGKFTSATQYTDVTIDASTELALSGDILVSGNWTNNGTFTHNNFGVTFNGAGAQTLTTGGSGAGKQFAAVTINKSGGTATLAGNLSDTTLNITAGTLDQGASFDIATGAVTVGASGIWTNTGTGDLILSGGVANAGAITFNANGLGCGQNDDISITSSSAGTQRAWSGAGTFAMTDVTVQDQGGTAVIGVRSGTNSGGNAPNWLFVSQCSAYTWSGGSIVTPTDWTVPANWSPARTTPATSDILYIGAGTPSPTITNVAGAVGGSTETIAELHIINSSPTFSTGGANNTLLINAGSGNTGLVISGLTITGSNALTIKLASGTLGTVGDAINSTAMIVQGGAHRLIGQAASAITFQPNASFTTNTGFTGNAFGDGSNAANGAAASIVFAGASTYYHNVGSSPFGASGNPSVVTFQTNSEAVFLTSSGFDASDRTYAILYIGDGGTAVNASASGTGQFAFQLLSVSSTPTITSTLTYNGTGSASVLISGPSGTVPVGIQSSGAGNTGTVPDINLTAPGGITVNAPGSFGAIFSNQSNSRALNLDGNVTVVSPTVLTLQDRVLMLGQANPNSKTLTVNNGAAFSVSNAYVIGSLKRTFTAAGSKTFEVGAANGYSPLDVNATTGTFPADFTVSATGTKLSSISGTNALSRYWTITNNVGGNTADLTFHYLAGDVVGTEANYKFFRYNGSFFQFNPSVLDTGTHIATLNGVSTFSDWTLAEPAAVVPGTLTFVGAPYSDSEGNVGGHPKTITVSRSGGSDGAVDVSYATSDGTATVADNDYVAASGTLHWNAGETTDKVFFIGVKGDTTYEANETVNITLSAVTDGATITAPNPTTLTITNDDLPPATLVVNTTDDVDNGACLAVHCSLREAINAANFINDPSTINFNIPNTDPGFAGGVFTIQPTTSLPTITTPTTVDGTSQTAFTGNTNVNGPEIVLNGSLTSGANGLTLSASNSTVKGLVVNGFQNGLSIGGASTSGCQFLNNYVGTDASGTVAVPNLAGGISVASNASSATISGNLISGNGTNGITTCDVITSTFSNNLIGTDRTGTSDVHNGSHGMQTFCTNFFSNTISGNTFAFNLGDGYRDEPDYNHGNSHLRTHLTQNSFFANTGLGINLLPPPFGTVDGVTPNDPQDPDTGANNLQNFPVITSAIVTGSTRIITGTLNTTPNSSAGYTIEFFNNSACDASGNGEGKTYLGSVTTGNTDANGDVSFTFNPASLTAGDIITATATDSTGNTSEFSACFTAVAGTAGQIKFVNAPFSVAENVSGGVAHITVERTGGSDGAISATFDTSDGTATTADNDYTAVTNYTVSYADGETGTKTIDITINDDSIYESNETVNLSLSATAVTRPQRLGDRSTSAASRGPNISLGDSATLTITNDDAAPSFAITASVSHFEGNSSTTAYDFVVTKTGATEVNSQVDFTTQDVTATQPSDYTLNSGTLSFAPSDTTRTITVLVNGDTTVEPDETFTVHLSSPVSATISSADGTGTIENDDIEVSVAVSPSSVLEDSGTPLVYTFTRNGVTSGSLTVNFSVGGTAIFGSNPGDDYTQTGAASFSTTAGTVTFTSGNATATVNINPTSDSTFEADETVILAVTSGAGYNVAANPNDTATGTITNDDNTLVVTKTDDTNNTCLPGDCSLREAINAANNDSSQSSHTINFEIPATDLGHYYYKDDGSLTPNGHVTAANVATTTASDDTNILDLDPDWPHSWWSIQPTSALPAITQQLTINGYSQPGASANTQDATDDAVIRIELNGVNAGNNVHGLAANSVSTLQGLTINHFTGNGIGLLSGSSSGPAFSTVTGNFIGTDVSGTLPAANGLAGLFMTNSSGHQVGCTVAGERNIISGNTGEGVSILTAGGNYVQGNFIGVAANGTSLLGNGGNGIEIYTGGSNNTIGVRPTFVVVATGQTRPEGGGASGCQRSRAASSGSKLNPTLKTAGRLGPTQALSGANVIAGNGEDGVRVSSAGDTGNLISQNSIFSNGSGPNGGLGINLVDANDPLNGVTPNDLLDADIGPNNLQNFPVLTGASDAGGTVTVNGTLDSQASQSYRIDLYGNSACDAPSGYGEGKTYLGSVSPNVTTDGSGHSTFTFTYDTTTFPGVAVVTATAIDLLTNDTSEFSACVTVTPVVCTPAPSGMVSWYSAEGNANDIIGTSNGTLQNGTTFAAGKVNQAFSFDGINDYVSTTDSPNFDFGAGDFAIDGWINTPTPGNTMRFVSAGSQADGANNQWTIAYGANAGWGPGNHLNFAYWNGSTYTDFTSSQVTIVANQWHHIAVVRSGSTLTFYFDGVAAGTGSIGAAVINSGSTGLIMGARYDATPSSIIEFATGLIDEVEVFNAAISAGDVANLYNAGNAGKCHTSTIQFSSATYSINETAGTATITVTRTGAHDTTAAVHYATSDGTGVAGHDYTNTSGDLNFAIGEVSRTFDVPVLQDNSFSTDHTVNLALSAVTGAGAGAPQTAILTIVDNDDTAPSLTIDNVSTAEGNSSTTDFVFTVTKTGATDLTTTVNFATQDSTANSVGGPCGTAGVDYEAQTSSLSFAPNETTKQITIHVCGDTAPEPNETFFVKLSSPGNATLGNTQGIGTIINDDADYTVTTTGSAIVVTDISGNSDVLTMSEPVAGAVDFAAPGRYFSVDGGTPTLGNSGNVNLSGVNSITVNQKNGDDTFNAGAFTPAFPSLTINGDAGDDAVNFTGNITFAANANLDVDLQNDVVTPGIDAVNFNAGVNVVLSGTGTATVRASKNITFFTNSKLQVANGDMTLEANQQAVATNGNFTGVNVTAATLTTTGTGKINVKGKGGVDTLTSLHFGIRVSGAATVSSTSAAVGAGTITLNGTGGTGVTQNRGVQFDNGSTATSVTGDISITGQGGIGTSSNQMGVLIGIGSSVVSTGAAKITLDGTGGSGTSSNTGVRVSDFGTKVTSAGGDISFIGHGGASATTTSNHGISVAFGGLVSATGGAKITFNGTAGGGTVASTGVIVALTGTDGVTTTPAKVTSDSGDISITGFGGTGTGAGSGGNIGVNISQAGSVVATGAAKITINGTGGACTAAGGNDCYGVDFESGNLTGTAVTSVNGNIDVTGTSTAATNLRQNGIRFEDSAGANAFTMATSGAGQVTLTATAGNNDPTSPALEFADDTLMTLTGATNTFIADTIDITNSNVSINAGANALTLRQKTNTKLITLGAADSATTLGLTDAELDLISAGTLNIGDSNSGDLQFTAPITRSAATIVNLTSGGAILLDNSLDSGGGNVTVTPGSASNVTAANSGVDVSMSTTGTLAFVSGAHLGINIAGTTVDTQYQQLNVVGKVNLTGVNLVLSGSPVLVGGETFVIVNNDGSDAITGTFNSLPEGAVITNFLGSGKNATITYVGGSNSNDVVLTVVACPASFTVNSNGDASDANPGDGVCATSGAVCTLRAAIEEANALPGCGTIDINFSISTPNTINLATALPFVVHNINFNGPGANLLTVQRSTAGGTPQFRVFTIQTTASGPVNISGLTISNGNVNASNAGAGIYLSSGTLTLTNSMVSGNTAGNDGGGIFNSDTLVLTNSTVSGNISGGRGGGITGFGTTTLINSTVSGNTGNDGGGIWMFSRNLFLTNSTVTGNSTSQNGGGVNLQSGGTVNARNTIIAGNSASSSGPDIFGSFTSQGNNLIGKSDGGSGFLNGSNGDKVGTVASPLDPLLGPLMNNGGATFTHALLYNSPAVDAGNDCVFAVTHCSDANIPQLTLDQRGLSRQADGDLVAPAHVDIGAYERQASESRVVPHPGSNVNVDLNDVRVSFPSTTIARGDGGSAANGSAPSFSNPTVSITVIDPSTQPTPPPGYSVGTTFNPPLPAFDVSTTATYTPPVGLCFYLPSITDPSFFAGLKVLHNEGGVLVDPGSQVNFALKIVCTHVSSLSPFVIGHTVTPSAANGSIGGKITDANGAPLAGTTINLSGTQTRETITDAQGNYSFDTVEANGFYTVTPARVNYTFNPASRSFSLLGVHTESSFTASASGDHANAIDTTEFFVRQQYLDFLGREPDPPGFIGWVNTLRNCAPGDASCDRIHVSEAFFRSQEFQERGYFVYRFYSSAFGRKPDFAEFTPDLARVSGFLDNTQLEAAKTAFANDFLARPAFAAQYGSLNNAAYVDALINTAQVNLGNRQSLTDGLNAGTTTRAQVLRQVAESAEVYQKYYNQAFVVMEYFGYLRRDPDALYTTWIQVLDANPADSRHMVDGFVNSTEYRNRFAQ